MHCPFPADICDEDPDRPVYPTPTASAVATRATQMVELLSSDNVALREKLQSVYHEMSRMQKVREEKVSLTVCNGTTRAHALNPRDCPFYFP